MAQWQLISNHHLIEWLVWSLFEFRMMPRSVFNANKSFFCYLAQIYCKLKRMSEVSVERAPLIFWQFILPWSHNEMLFKTNLSLWINHQIKFSYVICKKQHIICARKIKFSMNAGDIVWAPQGLAHRPPPQQGQRDWWYCMPLYAYSKKYYNETIFYWK